ncbi:MAG: peptide chain release factor 1 [Alphaproteobacteria bacterium]
MSASTFPEKLENVLVHHSELSDRLAASQAMPPQQMAALSKEYADMAEVVAAIQAWKKARASLGELEEMVADAQSDPEMRALAEDELHDARRAVEGLEGDIRRLLIPKDEADARNAILEVRAGTGGDEAALFAADLFRMYQRYADLRGWKTEVLSLSETGIGGYKEITATVSGRDVFSQLKFESGVHRVQRVPVTESGGRIHTSAATVAVLPEAEEVDVEIADKDIRVDVYRSSGPGGQSVNTTDSAVRITHLPTGLVVIQQDEKSQHKNKAKAMKVLRARLYDLERSRRDAERAASRKSQVGSGDRSERIRTYNFPQNRVTDHRINLTLHKLDQVISGEALGELIEALISEDQAALLAELE